MFTTTLNVTTKTADKSAKVVTAITFNWEGVTQEELQELATVALVAKARKEWIDAEAADVPQPIPAEFTINVADYAKPQRAKRGTGAVSAATKAVSKLTPEQKAELLRMLTEG